MKKRLLALLLAVALVAAMVPLGASAASVKFTDVKAGAYYEKAVAWAVENNVTAGTTPTTFSPDKPCTRAEAVSFLYRYARKDNPYPTEDKTCQFKDVAAADYFYAPVLWAQYAKVTAGTTETAFSPNKNCTRAEIVSFLWRMAGRPAPKTTVNPFKDVKASDYYYDAVLWAAGENITAGTTPTTFSPTSACKRCEIVSFLHRTATEKNVPATKDKLTTGSMALVDAVDLTIDVWGNTTNHLSLGSYSAERKAYNLTTFNYPVGYFGPLDAHEKVISATGKVVLDVPSLNIYSLYQTVNGYASLDYLKAGTDEVVRDNSATVSDTIETPTSATSTTISYKLKEPKGNYDVRLTSYDKTGKKVKSFLMDAASLADWYKEYVASDYDNGLHNLYQYVIRKYGQEYVKLLDQKGDILAPGSKVVSLQENSYTRAVDSATGHYVSDNTLGVVVTDTATGLTVKSQEGKLLGEIVMEYKDKNTYVTVAGNTLVVWEHDYYEESVHAYSNAIRVYHLTV